MISPSRHHIVWPEHITCVLFILSWKTCLILLHSSSPKTQMISMRKSTMSCAHKQQSKTPWWPPEVWMNPTRFPNLLLKDLKRHPNWLLDDPIPCGKLQYENNVPIRKSRKKQTNLLDALLWKVILYVLQKPSGKKTHYKVDAVRQSPAACSMIDWAIKNMSGITHGTL